MTLRVVPVLCNAGIMDNYAYIVTDEESGVTAVVDAAEEKAVVRKCKELDVIPSFILTTHHHEDHTNANRVLKKKYGLHILAPAPEKNKIPETDIALSDGEVFVFGKTAVQAVITPGHTDGHCMWYFAAEKTLFTGDMLFNLSIGGMFEGTPKQMWQSMQKIKAMPDDVRFYPGHEYTRMSEQYLLENRKLPEFQQYLDFLSQCRKENRPPVGNTLGLEKQCNPYLRIKNEDEFIFSMS